MKVKTKLYINIAVSLLSVISFIIFIVAIFKMNVYLETSTWELSNPNKISSDGWQIIHGGGTFKDGTVWAGSNTGNQATDIKKFQEFMTWNSKDVINLIKNLKGDTKEILFLAKDPNGQLVALVGNDAIITTFIYAIKSQGALFIASILIGLIGWISGIVTSIIVKNFRKKIGIGGGGASILFAVINLTGIPFLVSTIISLIMVSKELKVNKNANQ